MEEYIRLISEADSSLSLSVQVFSVVFIALLLDYLQKHLWQRMLKRIEGTEQIWDDALYYASKRSFSLLIWVIGFTLAAELVSIRTDAILVDIIPEVRNIGVIIAFTWFLSRLITGIERNLIRRAEERGESLDKTTVDGISKLLRASVFITSLLIMLQTLGISVSGVLAFGGVGGIAIGFAAKDLLANFFGGLMIYLDRPFAVGDWIRSPDRNIEGTVERIGWRQTCIRTFDKRPLYVPNATFASIAVENPSRMSHRRIYETMGIRYEDAGRMATIIEDVKKMLQEHPEIDNSQTMIVNFNAFAASSLDFFVYTFTHTTNWIRFHEIKQDVLLKIVAIIEGHGAEFAFPTSTIHLAADELPEPILPKGGVQKV